jgi:hypothetical protein
MKKIASYAIAALLASSAAQPASADHVYSVSASLQYGGTLTGTFTTNDANTVVESWDLVAPSSPGTGGHAFPGFEYTNSNSTVLAAAGAETSITFDTPGKAEELRLAYVGTLPTLGESLDASHSYESEHDTGGNRNFTSGTIAGVPEPASITLSASGLAILLAAWFRRKRCEAGRVQLV